MFFKVVKNGFGILGGLNANQFGGEPFDIESRQRGWLVTFDIHREEVDFGYAILLEEVIQGDGGHFNFPDLRLGVWEKSVQKVDDPASRDGRDSLSADV